MENSAKSNMFLRRVPLDLRELAIPQYNLEEDFDALRNYLLNQVGRKQVDGVTAMEIGRMANDEDCFGDIY